MRRRAALVAPAALALWLCWPGTAMADALAADLTRHLIAITTGFTGASVVLFGATDGPGDVVVVVRGPAQQVTVRRKQRIAGVWVNTAAMTFADVPSFYFIAASRPLAEMVDPRIAAVDRLGLDHLHFEPEAPAPPRQVAAFVAALIRTQQRLGLFPRTTEPVQFIGERLFRTTIAVPATVPTGTYRVETLLFRDHRIVALRTTPLVVSKIGVDAAVFDFASRQPALYGAIAVAIAMVAGWLASLPFRGA
jgi:uncharacterized protein (TIGR02186 family)